MSANQDLAEYRRTLPTEAVLGRLWWYSISELCVPHTDVVAALTAVGLAHIAPPHPRDSDVFRRVTSAAERKRVPTNRDGVFRNYLIRNVSSDTSATVRRVVVETRNTAGKRLAYDQVVDFEYDRDASSIGVTVLATPRKDAVLDEIVAGVLSEFDRWRGQVHSYAIREMIRHLLLKAGATCVRESGGIYFLPEANVAPLTALEDFVPSLGDAVNLHSLPVPDNEKQRGMVREAFEAESTDAVDRMMGEITDIRKDGKPISEDRYARMLDDYRSLVARTNQYGNILEDSLSGTKSRLEIFQRQIVQLLELVK